MRRFVIVGGVGLALAPGCEWREECKNLEGIAVVHVDPRFSVEEAFSIGRASLRWNLFAGHPVIETRRHGEPLPICTIIDSPAVAPVPNAQAVTHHGTGNIEIGSALSCSGEPVNSDPKCFEAIVMHEMGHLLGLPHHTDGVDGIMRGTGGASLDFTDADRRACEAFDVCR